MPQTLPATKTATTSRNSNLKIISFNLQGFNHGFAAIISELIDTYKPEVLLLQEHWLTPANLSKSDIFSAHFSFGCSAMSDCVASGVLTGRPFGGVMSLISNCLRESTQTIHCSERYVLVKIGSCLIFNVYLPCIGKANRHLLYQDILNAI